MTTIDTVSENVSFRTRLLGFDRQEVRAFIANIAEDYQRVRNELGELQGERHVPHDAELTRASSGMTRDVQRVIDAACRVAQDVERKAGDEGARIVAQAQAAADDIVADAHRRADEITMEARRELRRLEERTAAMIAQCARLRSAFETAADTAGAALSDIASASAGTDVSSTDHVNATA